MKSYCLERCLSVILFVPLGELAEALTERNFRGEADITLKGGGISVGGGDITWSFDKLKMYCMGILCFQERVLSLSKQRWVIA